MSSNGAHTITSLADMRLFVNDQLNYHARQCDSLERKLANSNNNGTTRTLQRRLKNHQKQAALCSSACNFVENINEEALSTRPPTNGEKTVSTSVGYTPEDLAGLPPELMNQLKLSESDELELDIQNALRKVGAPLPVDKIMIQIFHDTGKILERGKLAAKLYRMTRTNGTLVADSDKKGCYGLPEMFTNQPVSTIESVPQTDEGTSEEFDIKE